MDKRFFERAIEANRAVDFTDLEAIIPANTIKHTAEFRAPLPNRRLKTVEEREAEIENRYIEITSLEESIEEERKKLLDLVKEFRVSSSGAAKVIVQNEKVKELIEKRSKLSRPLRWIKEIEGQTLKDIFESKRDVRKIGSAVFAIKTRVEPIESLYVDLAKEAAETTKKADEITAQTLLASQETAKKAPPTITEVVGKLAEDASAATAAIIGQRVKAKTIRLKTPGPPRA